jgi:hypothetical protein
MFYVGDMTLSKNEKRQPWFFNIADVEAGCNKQQKERVGKQNNLVLSNDKIQLVEVINLFLAASEADVGFSVGAATGACVAAFGGQIIGTGVDADAGPGREHDVGEGVGIGVGQIVRVSVDGDVGECMGGTVGRVLEAGVDSEF